MLFDIVTEERVAKDILLDRYGNYVFQTALQVSVGRHRCILRDVRNNEAGRASFHA